MYKAADRRQGAPGRKVQIRVSFRESVTYLPAPPTHMRVGPAQMMEVTTLFWWDAGGWSACWVRDGVRRKGSKRAHQVGFALWADVASLPRYVRPVPEAEMRRHSRIFRVSHKMERRSARNRRRWFSANASGDVSSAIHQSLRLWSSA